MSHHLQSTHFPGIDEVLFWSRQWIRKDLVLEQSRRSNGSGKTWFWSNQECPREACRLKPEQNEISQVTVRQQEHLLRLVLEPCSSLSPRPAGKATLRPSGEWRSIVRGTKSSLSPQMAFCTYTTMKVASFRGPLPHTTCMSRPQLYLIAKGS